MGRTRIMSVLGNYSLPLASWVQDRPGGSFRPSGLPVKSVLFTIWLSDAVGPRGSNTDRTFEHKKSGGVHTVSSCGFRLKPPSRTRTSNSG